jgi:hypothetical protein
MKRLARLIAMVTGLVLMLNNTSSGGTGATCSSPGCNSTVSDAHENTAGGTGALANVDETGTGGFNNTAFGAGALDLTTTGDQNTAIGATALQHNTVGSENTASGFQAPLQNIGGNSNTATGANALSDNTTGNKNTATGANALIANTTGILNTATGTDALNSNITGKKNTAVGSGALSFSTGSQNIGIGYLAGNTLTSGNNNIYIGNQGAGDEFQTIRLGSVQTRTFIAGIATTPIVESYNVLVINSATGQLGLFASSARYKRDIVAMGTRSEKVHDLRPVTFAYKDDAKGVTHYGLVAEEVAAVYPELVGHTAAGDVQTVKYQELIPMLLNELQHERQDRRDEVAALRQELAALRALVGWASPR